MYKSKIKGTGHYVPERIVTNDELARLMNTSDEWIRERTGIAERRYAQKHKETPTTMAKIASEMAIRNAGITANDIDFIVFATLSPDYYFPGCGVLLQRLLNISGKEVGALDVRNQCSGFVYALSIADQFIRSGMYKNILVVGSEMHSMGLDLTDRGRNISVIFGDGAGAVVVQAEENGQGGILASKLHANGDYAEELCFISPGSHGGYWKDQEKYGFSENPNDSIFVTRTMLDDALLYPYMNGQNVFKFAVQKFPEVIMETLNETGHNPGDLDMLIPHQANLRISKYVQEKLGLPDEKVFNNIQKYGNTTAASIPIALSEAFEQGKIKAGDLVCLAAFGSGFTWGANLIRW